MHKRVLILLLVFLMAFSYLNNKVHAEQLTIIAEGTSRVGENETEVQAKRRAWVDAQQKAIEEAGVVIESYTAVNNHQIVEDWIQNIALAKVQTKLIMENRSYEGNLIVFHVKLECKINSEDVNLLNTELYNLTLIKIGKINKINAANSLPKSEIAQSVKDLLLPDGSIYTGALLNDFPDGRGIKKYSDGGKYEGTFRKGFRHGSGTMIWVNGDRYTGYWLSDMRCGQGEFINAKGVKQVGRWNNDIFLENNI